MDLVVWPCLVTYFVVLGHFIALTLPSIRMKHKLFKPYPARKDGENFYERNLHYIVLVRQILLFFLPLAVGTVVLQDTVLSQLSSLFVLGLSLNVFWIVQLPLLNKAKLLVTYSTKPLDEEKPIDYESPDEHYDNYLELQAGKINRVICAIYNLGFHTYKNAMVILYFGPEIEVIPCDDFEYKPYMKKLDFNKIYSVQKKHGGAAFSSKDNYLTIPPQEVFLFPVLVRIRKTPVRDFVLVQFSSETSWGITEVKKPIKLSLN
jgi:hypothetical protein